MQGKRPILLGGTWKLVAWGREAVLWFGEEEMGEDALQVSHPRGTLVPPWGHSWDLATSCEAARAGFTYPFCRWKRDVWGDLAGHRECSQAGGTSSPALVPGMLGALVAGSLLL